MQHTANSNGIGGDSGMNTNYTKLNDTLLSLWATNNTAVFKAGSTTAAVEER